MRALVTGGAGFVGTNLIKKLLLEGHDVISVDDYSTGFFKNEQSGCKYFNADITNDSWGLSKIRVACPCESSCACRIEDVDCIFHLAALPRIKPSFKNPTEVINVNVNGTGNVLEYARKHNIPVIYAGSSSFHGGVYKNPYTFSKWQGEELCKMYEKIYELKVSICRFYNVYGDHMPRSGEYRTVLPIFLDQYRKGEYLTITGDGKQRRDFTHVDDIVDAMVKVVELEEYGNIFELGRGKNYSIKEVVKMFPVGKQWKYIPKIPGEARHTLCESKLAKELLGWKPQRNLEEWIGEQL